MASVSLKKNFLYSSVLTSSNFFFAFITYPYVSRVLGVANMGVCNWIDSIINYFLLFSMMGIVIVGNREIAANKDNRNKLNSTYSSLLTLNGLFTLIATLVLLVLIFFVPKFTNYRCMLFVGLIKLALNFLTVDWLYKGLEKFQYVTACNLIVKIIYVILVFALVREEKDYVIYYVLSVFSIVITSLINIFYARNFVTYKMSFSNFRAILRPFLTYGLYTILTSAYTSLNITYLGFVAGEVEVGYYTTATKLFNIIISLFTALTGVVLPRASFLYSHGRTDELEEILKKTLNILFCIGIPIVIIGMICADNIIYIIAGAGYEGAVKPMQISMPLVLVIGLEQILIIQGLMPMKQDKSVMRGTIMGALLSVITNLIFTSLFASIGAAIVWFVSEIAVLANAQYSIKKFLGLTIPFKNFFMMCVRYIPLILILCLLKLLNLPVLVSFLFSILCAASYFVMLEIVILKNPVLIYYVTQLNIKK